MYLIVENDGVLEVRWSWLPFWIAMNPAVITSLDRFVQARIAAGVTDIPTLHADVISNLAEQFPGITGLARALDAIREVSLGG